MDNLKEMAKNPLLLYFALILSNGGHFGFGMFQPSEEEVKKEAIQEVHEIDCDDLDAFEYKGHMVCGECRIKDPRVMPGQNGTCFIDLPNAFLNIPPEDCL